MSQTITPVVVGPVAVDPFAPWMSDVNRFVDALHAEYSEDFCNTFALVTTAALNRHTLTPISRRALLAVTSRTLSDVALAWSFFFSADLGKEEGTRGELARHALAVGELMKIVGPNSDAAVAGLDALTAVADSYREMVRP